MSQLSQSRKVRKKISLMLIWAMLLSMLVPMGASATDTDGTDTSVISAPTPVEGLTGYADSYGVQLSWIPNSDADFYDYRIYYAQGSTVSRDFYDGQLPEFTVPQTVGQAIIPYDNGDGTFALQPGMEYSFAVYAVNSAGEYSEPAITTVFTDYPYEPPYEVPAPVSDFYASVYTDELTLTWTPNWNPDYVLEFYYAEGYDASLDFNDGVFYADSSMGHLTVPYEDGNGSLVFQPNTTYTFTAYVVNTFTGEYSEPVTSTIVTPPDTTTPPPSNEVPTPVADLTAVAGTTGVNLSWTPNSDSDFGDYRIYFNQGTEVSNNNNQGGFSHFSLGQTMSQFTVDYGYSDGTYRLQPDTEYSFAVYVVNTAEVYSAPAIVTITTPPVDGGGTTPPPGDGGTTPPPTAPEKSLPTPNPKTDDPAPTSSVQVSMEIVGQDVLPAQDMPIIPRYNREQTVWAKVYLENLQNAKGADFSFKFDTDAFAFNTSALQRGSVTDAVYYGAFEHQDLHVIYNLDQLQDGKVNISFASKNEVTGSTEILIPLQVIGQTDRYVANVAVQDFLVVDATYQETIVNNSDAQALIRTKGTVKGYINLQGRDNHAGARVVAMMSNGDETYTKVDSAQTDQEGYFLFDLEPGSYIFLADREKYQSGKWYENAGQSDTINVVQGITNPISMTLNTGDAVGPNQNRVGDDRVSLLDLTQFVEDFNYGVLSDVYDPEFYAADFDADRAVNGIDFSWLAMNYNLKGISAVHGFTNLDDYIHFLETPQHVGELVGTVVDAYDRSGVEGASVVAYREGYTTSYQVQTNSNGNYSMTLPQGNYRVVVSADGYYSVTSHEVIAQDETVYGPTLRAIATQYVGDGVVSGVITNAQTGSGVSGLTIRFREGVNSNEGTVVGQVTTGSGGSYSIELPTGHYTGEITGDGYTTAHINVVSLGGITTPNQNTSISMIVPEGQTRIVLSWDAQPRDLDSHLTGPSDNGRFHIYYGYRTHNDTVSSVDLDTDVVTGYGPETVTIRNQSAGVYRYYVYNWSNEASMSSASNARVEVYRGDSRVAVYNVPVNQAGRYWQVFELEGDVIRTINTIGDYAPNSVSSFDDQADDLNALFSNQPEKTTN